MTSIVTGSKANDGVLSIAPNVLGPDPVAAAKPENRLKTILEQEKVAIQIEHLLLEILRLLVERAELRSLLGAFVELELGHRGSGLQGRFLRHDERGTRGEHRDRHRRNPFG